MFIKILKWASVLALLAGLFVQPYGGYSVMVQMIVCVGAIMVAVQAFHTSRVAAAVVFIAVAVLFNPVVPVELPRTMFLAMTTLSLALFLLSVITFRQNARLSMASITDRTPGSESL